MKKGLIISALIVTSILAIVGIVLSIDEYHKGQSGASGIMLAIVGVIGTIASLIGLIKNKTKERQQILLDFATATKLADEKLVEEINLRDKTIAALKEELARKNLPVWEQTVKGYLEKGELQKAIKSIDTPASYKEAAAKHIRKAQLYTIDYQIAKAEKEYQKAVTVFPSYHSHLAIADFYYDLNKFPEAIMHYNRCLHYATSPQERAIALNNMGNMHYKMNEYREAEKYYEAALQMERELAGEDRETYLPNVAKTINNLGITQLAEANYPKAEEYFNEALQLRRELIAKDRETYLPDIAETLNNLGILQTEKNDFDEAERTFKEALEIKRELAKICKVYPPDIVLTLNNLGILNRKKCDYEEAVKYYKEALQIQRELAAKNSDAYLPDVALTLNNLGNMYKDKRALSEAEASYIEALQIRKELTVKNSDAYSPDLATSLFNLSFFYQENTPNIDLSLKYALEAKEVLAKCNDTLYVQRLRDSVDKVIAMNNFRISFWKSIGQQ